MEEANSRVLLKHYEELLELYTKLEAVSQKVFEVLQSGLQVGELTPLLKENASFAESIRRESEAIVSMKETLAKKNVLTESERILVKEAEQNLSKVVNRVIEQETRSRNLTMSQGVKISRK